MHPPKVASYDNSEPIATEDAIDALRQLFRRNIGPDTVHRRYEEMVISRVDAEREALASLALELEVSPAETPIRLAAHVGVDAAVAAALSIARRRFAKLCRDRVQYGENDDAPEDRIAVPVLTDREEDARRAAATIGSTDVG